jgi:hypothetical protein
VTITELVSAGVKMIDIDLQEVIDELYSLNGTVTDEQYATITNLRQLINEEFVAKGKQITTQTVYNMVKDLI